MGYLLMAFLTLLYAKTFLLLVVATILGALAEAITLHLGRRGSSLFQFPSPSLPVYLMMMPSANYYGIRRFNFLRNRHF
jgi:hypothetical protein